MTLGSKHLRHTSANAAVVAKLLCLNKCQVAHPAVQSMAVPSLNDNSNRNVMWSDYCQNLMVSSVAHMPLFHWILCLCILLLINKQTDADKNIA